MFKKLFFLILFLVIVTPVLAVSWPPEVKPEQGKAWAKIEVRDSYDGRVLGESYREIAFWNVGQVSGNPEYAKAIFSADCAKSTTPGCRAGDPVEGIFSGGPNGVVTISGYEYKLHDGQYFEAVSGGITTKYTVENPEIFSKYRWDEEETPQDSGENSIAELLNVYGEDIKIFPDSDQNARTPAKWGSKLVPGTHIDTGTNSVTIRFTKGSGYHLTPNSEVVLISGDPKPKLRLVKGEMQATGHDPFEIDMDQAVCDVQGTTFVVKQASDTSTLKVIDGTVLFTSKANGKTETVTAGETVSADKNGLGQKTTFDPVAEKKKWQDLEDNLKKTNTNILGDKNIIYILGGVVIVAAIIGFLLIKVRQNKKQHL